MEKINYIAKQLPKYTSPIHLQSALRLCERGAVKEAEMIKQSSIEAKVGNYQVKINLDFLLYSSCTCGYKGICEHIAAVFMSVYSLVESPAKLFMTETSAPRSQLVSTMSAPKHAPKAAPKPDRKPSPVARLPQSSDTPEQWLRYFEQKFKTYHSTRSYSISHLFEKILGELTGPARVWNKVQAKLYTIHAVLFSLQRLEEKFQTDSDSHHRREDYERSFGILHSTLFSASDDDGVTFGDSTQPYLESIHAMLTQTPLVSWDTPVNWLIVYCRLWWTVLKHPKRMIREKRRIKALIHESALTSEEKAGYVRVLAHLEAVSGEDQKAQERLVSYIEEHASDFPFILHHLARTREWDRMIQWLKWYPIDRFRKSEYVQQLFSKYCALVGKQNGTAAEQAGALLKANLPYSFQFYAAYLLHANQPKAWVDLHIWAGFDPSHLAREDLARIESLDVSLLLPMYHQSVEGYISMRNRSGYKEAVMLLKKLRLYYKKLNKPSLWETYIQRLLAQHRRLRAFCEELEKGNLMS
jgi:hypothetical protein